MLQCRWMCEASLRVYRRLGNSESEQNFRKAMVVNVDCIQQANVVQVVGDQSYAFLLHDLSSRTPERSSAIDTFAAASRGDRTDATLPPPMPRQPPRPPGESTSASPSRRPLIPTARDDQRPLTSENALGRRCLVPAARWPNYRCNEFGGLGWEAQIVSTTTSTALVKFTNATTRDGRAYANERVPLCDLHPL